MTLMAVDVGVFTLGPLLVRVIMHMAGKTGIGIVFKVIIDLVRDEEHGERKEKEDADDYYTGFCGNSLAEPYHGLFQETNRIEYQQIPPQQPAALFM